MNKGASNLDDLDLNPLLVQADPGENLRYCKDNHINKVPETLDEKIWLDIKDKVNLQIKIILNMTLKILQGLYEQVFNIIFTKNMAMKN